MEHAQRELNKELVRVAEICHGCRLCFNLCDSFPELFSMIDERDGEVEKLDFNQLTSIAESCFECKLCYPKCPYTPPHRYALDFPKLMQDVKNYRAKTLGVDFRHFMMSQPVLMGKIGSLAAPLANRLMHFSWARKVMQGIMGIHAQRMMPRFHSQTFAKWFKKQAKREGDPVVLFCTCFVNYHKPETGQAAVFVLEKMGFSVKFPPQDCCGMPALDVGDEARAKRWLLSTVESLYSLAKDGVPIVSPGPSCSLMLKRESLQLFPNNEKVATVAKATRDLMEFLFEHKERLTPLLGGEGRKIAYHFPCHLRLQNIGPKSAQVLKFLPQTEVRVVEQCSAMDGTWGMTASHYPRSLDLSQKLVQELKAGEARASDCPLAGLQLEEQTGQPTQHPVEILAESIREGEEGQGR